jgi:aminoglycoside 6-adenylyltransferase
MFEWHTMAMNPEPGDTWYGGRHIEVWAAQRWLPPLRQAWSRFDVADSWNALLSTLGLFSDVATETGRLLGYGYPADDELRVRDWIEARRAVSRGD